MTRPIKFIPPIEAKISAPITVVNEGINSPQVLNQTTSASPNTETSILLAAPVRFRIVNRGTAVVKLSFAAGQSGTVFSSLFPNAPYVEDGLSGATITLRVQSPSASQRLELITWA